MTNFKSMTDVAYDVMSKKKRSMTFSKLWEEVANRVNIANGEEAIAEFYTDLTLDGRFASLKDNKWDLKERHTFEETYVNLADMDADDEEEEEVDAELEDEEDGEMKNEEDY